MAGKTISKIFSIFFLTSLTVFILHSLFTGTSVFADAKFYYSYTRSIIFDHDLLLGNEFFNLGLLKEMPSYQFTPSFYPPGVSMFWVPLFYLTLGATRLIQIFIPDIMVTGYEPVFEYSCGITNILLGTFALYLIFKILSRYFSSQVSIFTTSALLLTTNLFFYIAVEPINSHAASFFVSALFIYYFLNHPKDKYYYLTLGLIGGFAGVVRTQDLLILILPIIQIIFIYRKRPKTLIAQRQALLIAGIFVGFLPQILLWKYFYHTFWYSPYFDTGFSFLKPQILHVLFNTQNGLFTITPIVIFALAGLLFMIFTVLRKISNLNLIWNLSFEFWIFLYALLYFLLQLYIISSWNVYTQGGSYSIRMMVTTYPLLSFGLAYVIEKVIKKIGENKTIYIIGGFTILNFLSILNYMLRY